MFSRLWISSEGKTFRSASRGGFTVNSSFSYCEIRLGNEKRSASDISRGFCSMSVFYYMAFPLTAVGKVLLDLSLLFCFLLVGQPELLASLMAFFLVRRAVEFGLIWTQSEQPISVFA